MAGGRKGGYGEFIWSDEIDNRGDTKLRGSPGGVAAAEGRTERSDGGQLPTAGDLSEGLIMSGVAKVKYS